MESRHLTPEQLSASLDGELSATEQRQVEAHLADCGECQRELAQLQQTVGLLRTLPAAVPTRSFRVTESARPVAAAPRWWAQPIWLRGLGSAAAALMVMVLAIDAVLPTMQVSTSVSGSAGAPASQLAPAPLSAQEKSDAAPPPSQVLQSSSDNATERAVVEDQAAKLEGAPPQAFAEGRPTESPRPQWVLSRPAQLIGVALGVATLLLFLAAALVRRPRA